MFYVGPLQAHVGSTLGHVGSMFCCPGPNVGPCWAYVAPMLGQYWDMLGHAGCWTHVGPCHVVPKFGNLADFQPLEKKRGKTQGKKKQAKDAKA